MPALRWRVGRAIGGGAAAALAAALLGACTAGGAAGSRDAQAVVAARSLAGPEADRALVGALFDDLQAAVAGGDLERALSHFDPELLMLPPGAPAQRGTAALREQLAGALAANAIAMEEELLEVHRTGDHLIAIGHYWHRIAPRAGGTTVLATGRFLVVLRPDAGGRWRIFRDMLQPAPDELAMRVPATLGGAARGD